MVGFVAWVYGRRRQSARHMVLGAALIAYSYFVPNPWLCFSIGAVLALLLFWP